MLNDVVTPEGADAGPRAINRRTIAKGVAWTVPVIVMATAAPAAAASSAVVTPTASFVPTAGNGRATVVVIVSVTSPGAGRSITFSGLAQGATNFPFAGTTTFALANGSNTFTLTTAASETIAPVGSSLTYVVTGQPATVAPVAIAPVTTLANPGVTVSGTGSHRTFTGTFSLRNSNSRVVVQSITTPAKKNNTTPRPAGPLTWGPVPVSVDDIGNLASVTLSRPSDPPYNDVDWAHTTITGTVDNIPFTRIVDAS